MIYLFNCYGHENITAKHRTTLEFTKDEVLGLEGNCIVGIKADFDLEGIRKFIERLSNNKVTITIETINNKKIINNKNAINKNDNNIGRVNNIKNGNNKIIEKINAEINPGFNSDKDMVIRKSDFIDERTFAVNADKAAFGLNRGLAGFLKDKENRIRVTVGNRQ